MAVTPKLATGVTVRGDNGTMGARHKTLDIRKESEQEMRQASEYLAPLLRNRLFLIARFRQGQDLHKGRIQSPNIIGNFVYTFF